MLYVFPEGKSLYVMRIGNCSTNEGNIAWENLVGSYTVAGFGSFGIQFGGGTFDPNRV